MAKDETIWFLITYDRKKLRMADMEQFHDGEKAVDLYGERERQYADQPHMEVVLLGAECEEAIRATHPTYFRDFKAEPLTLDEFYCDLPWEVPSSTEADPSPPRPPSHPERRETVEPPPFHLVTVRGVHPRPGVDLDRPRALDAQDDEARFGHRGR